MSNLSNPAGPAICSYTPNKKNTVDIIKRKIFKISSKIKIKDFISTNTPFDLLVKTGDGSMS